MAVLESHPETRSSDDLLYYYICEKKLYEKGYGIVHMRFADVWLDRKEYGLPPFETVRRTRQKVQSQHPELRAAADVEAMRMALEDEYRDYARGVGV